MCNRGRTILSWRTGAKVAGFQGKNRHRPQQAQRAGPRILMDVSRLLVCWTGLAFAEWRCQTYACYLANQCLPTG